MDFVLGFRVLERASVEVQSFVFGFRGFERLEFGFRGLERACNPFLQDFVEMGPRDELGDR